MDRESCILCCCSGGKVRSVAAKYILEDTQGCTSVLTLGLNKTDGDTQEMLFGWAEYILVVGQKKLTKLVPKEWRYKVIHLDVGKDVYGVHCSPELLRKLHPMIKELMT